MNDSMKNSPVLSPKISKQDSNGKEEESRQYLMKKKSPLKPFDEKEPTGPINTSINYNNNLLKNEQYAKNDRSNRFELLLKNHAKCSSLNQMILDMFRLEQPRGIYISYYLFRSIEKEMSGLFESLKKESPN